MIPKSEVQMRKKEIALSPQDVQELITYKDVFIKFIDKSIHAYQAKLWMLWYKLEEIPWVYQKIESLQILKNSIEETHKNYKSYINELEKSKEKA